MFFQQDMAWIGCFPCYMSSRILQVYCEAEMCFFQVEPLCSQFPPQHCATRCNPIVSQDTGCVCSCAVLSNSFECRQGSCMFHTIDACSQHQVSTWSKLIGLPGDLGTSCLSTNLWETRRRGTTVRSLSSPQGNLHKMCWATAWGTRLGVPLLQQPVVLEAILLAQFDCLSDLKVLKWTWIRHMDIRVAVQISKLNTFELLDVRPSIIYEQTREK